jgi:hypothetical protein
MMEALASSDWWRIVSVFGLGGFFSLITIINPPATLPFFSSLCGRPRR